MSARPRRHGRDREQDRAVLAVGVPRLELLGEVAANAAMPGVRAVLGVLDRLGIAFLRVGHGE